MREARSILVDVQRQSRLQIIGHKVEIIFHVKFIWRTERREQTSVALTDTTNAQKTSKNLDYLSPLRDLNTKDSLELRETSSVSLIT